MYQAVQSRLQSIIATEANDVSFTSDAWSDPVSGLALLSLTAHWITPEFNRRQAVLYASQLEDSHTGDYLGRKLVEMLENVKIPTTKVHLLLRDNGANMVKAMKVAEIDSIGCFAHTLQLVISKPILCQRAVSDVLSMCRTLCSRFRTSIQAQEKLAEIQQFKKKTVKKLQQDVSTRWNSSLHMLQSVSEQREVLTFYLNGLADEDRRGMKIEEHQWTLIDNLVDTLAIFDDVTVEVSGSSSSLAVVMPAVNLMRHHLALKHDRSLGIQTMRGELLKALNSRFDHITDNEKMVMATVLDPRYIE
jgi:hypothetical protein